MLLELDSYYSHTDNIITKQLKLWTIFPLKYSQVDFFPFFFILRDIPILFNYAFQIFRVTCHPMEVFHCFFLSKDCVLSPLFLFPIQETIFLLAITNHFTTNERSAKFITPLSAIARTFFSNIVLAPRKALSTLSILF